MDIVRNHKLHLLKKKEIDEIYKLPKLDDKERSSLFSLNKDEADIVSQLHTFSSKFAFIIQLGFFKAGKRFYTLEQMNKDEATKKYVSGQYFLHVKNLSLDVTRPTRLFHQSAILTLFNYKKCAGDVMIFVKKEIERLANIHNRPSYIIRELLRFLNREKIIIPAYSNLQNMIGMAVESLFVRTEKKLDNILSEKQKKVLDELVTERESFLHQLTCLKRTPKDFTLKEVLSTITKRDKLVELHANIDLCTKNIVISDHNFFYYAQLVIYYTIFNISRMPVLKRRLLLFCFVHVRYKMINNYLIKAFLYRVHNYVREAKKKVTDEKKEDIVYHKKDNRLGRMLLLLLNKMYLPNDISMGKGRESLFSILDERKIEELAYSLIAKDSDKKSLEWEQLEKMSRRIRTNIRPLVFAFEFEAQPSSLHLVRAINALKKKLKQGNFPKKVITPDLFSKSVSKHVYPKKDTLKLRYEFQLYKTIADRINSGDIFFTDSVSYRSFEQDIIDINIWKNNKERILASLGLPKLITPLRVLLNDLKQELNGLYSTVNERILRGKNPHIEWNERKWKLLSEREKIEETHRIDILDSMPPIGLSTLLNFVNRQTSFTDGFTHIVENYTKKDKSVSALLATITACATNMGIGKMARNANVNYESIKQSYRNFLRPETLKSACDMVSDKIKELSVFSQWNIDDGRVYSSSDGQKFGVSRETYNARYSSKYFGREKGIVSYTLEANYLPINSRIIGANEHESHFVLDILLDNTSEIKPDIHTTDSHGSNRINFALLYLFDYVFAPRYKNPLEVAKNIYIFSGLDKYENYVFKPRGSIDVELIEQEWDNILRIVASLATKTTSQSTIVRKLSAFPRKNKTCKAIGELNKIVRSIHILRYIDEVEFRKHIQKSINRLESYHSLKRAIFYDNKGKFKVKSEVDQNIWSECTRLLALNIIYYNSFIFSKIADRHLRLGKKIDFLKYTSPIQWKNIDMFGHFEFGDTPNESELQEVIKAIETLSFS